MKRTITAIALLAAIILGVDAAGQNVKEFKQMTDSLSTLIKERTSVTVKLGLRSVTKRGENLDFYFSDNLEDLPWREKDVTWFKGRIKALLPKSYSSSGVGRVYCRTTDLDNLVTPGLSSNGRPQSTKYTQTDRKGRYTPLLKKVGGLNFPRGLSDRHIALWQSHGRYYETSTKRWEWQRAQTWLTVEDMYTQSYVIPFLIPMLENAGAYVMTPRERDTQIYESVVDNDPAFKGERKGLIRRSGKYSESGSWSDAGEGFADAKAIYAGDDNPFKMGSVRMAKMVESSSRKSEAIWTPDIPERGSYAVYISYKSLPSSTTAAHYTVHHMGGKSEFLINQKMGGGTWIYLGTFEFDKGSEGRVTLDNVIPHGSNASRESVVTADGVRFGGGMGKIARGEEDVPVEEWETSGMPSYMEGALYWMQWAGADTTITRLHETDYTNDYADRGPWVGLMSGGSYVNPEEEGKGIPIDLSFAFHSDAGTTPNDSIVGTLSIYTLLADGKQKLPAGGDRMACREFADIVQTQIVQDIRADFEPEWSRRMLWNRSYSESRTPPVPAMLLELLSHQNFADMKYGLDPTFRFTVSRAIYKGMLKFLSNRYGVQYKVQPLPVNSFEATRVSGTSARLSWEPTPDPLEPTANPTGYIVYTRIDDGAFDTGLVVGEITPSDGGRVHVDMETEPGHIYSYRIVAYNEGGMSFPSEVLCVGTPSRRNAAKEVLIVNNFDRVSPPTWFDTPDYAGFDQRLDGGVAYGEEINYIGEQYQFRRSLPWVDDDNPGFGGSYTDFAGKKLKGNTFDFVATHAAALLGEGYAVSSSSEKAFAKGAAAEGSAFALDIICGKQVTTTVGRGGAVPDRFTVFPKELQDEIRKFTSKGGNVLISGAHIGTDAYDLIYPRVTIDEASRADTQKFIEEVLGYKWLTNYATRNAEVRTMKSAMMTGVPLPRPFKFHNAYNEEVYFAETPDGLLPSNDKGSTFLRYSDTNISAGVCYEGNGYKTVSLGFPIEVIKQKEDMGSLMKTVMEFFQKQPQPTQ